MLGECLWSATPVYPQLQTKPSMIPYGGIPSRDTLGEGYLANRQGGGNSGHVLVQDRHRLGASSSGQRGTFARLLC